MGENYVPKVRASLPAPRAEFIVAEVAYKSYRIVQTNDPEWLGYGTTPEGLLVPYVLVVLDEFDDLALPIGMQVHYTLLEAKAAIDIRDIVFPLKAGPTWPTTALHEYAVFQSYRRNFPRVMEALARIKKSCVDAKDFDDNPGEDVLQHLHLLNMVIVEGSKNPIS